MLLTRSVFKCYNYYAIIRSTLKSGLGKMRNPLNKMYGSGIRPLYDCVLAVREITNTENRFTAAKAKKFLLSNGFCEAPLDVVNLLSDIVSRYANGEKLRVENAYKDFATDGESVEAVRAKLTFYIEKNFDRVRESLLRSYGFDINKDFMGNKNFSRKIGLIFSASEEKE